MNIDEVIKLAAPHFSVTSKGELSRDSTPYPMNKKARMGVGFEMVMKKEGYKCFHHRQNLRDKRAIILTHRMIFYKTYGYLPYQVAHQDNHRLNNLPSNLRAASHLDNCRNKSSLVGSSSKFLGVSKYGKHNKWRARIVVSRKEKHLGSFDTQEEAALAYNKGAIELFGEFANINNVKF